MTPPWHYQNNQLYVENCAIKALAQACPTPFYVYSAAQVEENFRQFQKQAGTRAHICFAVKANSNQAILTLLAGLGAGADIVSEGEGRRALAAGIAPQKIYFSGAGKTNQELRFALDEGLGQINVESEAELTRLAHHARTMKKTAPIALRVNPDIKAGAHDKISTGKKEDKFGMAFDEIFTLYQKASTQDCFKMKGLAIHIGSQITQQNIFNEAWQKLGTLTEKLRAHSMKVETLDLGGGLGISAERSLAHDITAYTQAACALGQKYQCEIVLSPGRAIVGIAGALITSVIEEKKAEATTFLILDAAMNDLLRPALYDAHHPVLPQTASRGAASKGKNISYQLVGPVCESGDRLGRDVLLPQQSEGNLLAIIEAGAYGAVLSSTYNSRLLVPEVIVHNETFALVRPRQSYETLIKQDKVPEWIREKGKG